MSKSIAVIGAGIFGTTIALRLVSDGHQVKLIESHNDILKGTSYNNTRRVSKNISNSLYGLVHLLKKF